MKAHNASIWMWKLPLEISPQLILQRVANENHSRLRFVVRGQSLQVWDPRLKEKYKYGSI